MLPSPVGAGVVLELDLDLAEKGSTPMFYEVSGPRGVVAQGPLLYEVSPNNARFRHGGWPAT